MTSKFTPGPYCDDGDGCIRQLEQNEGHRLFIAQVIEIPFNFGGDRVTEANIALLAAAPEMYAALKFIADKRMELGFDKNSKVMNITYAALAKADGKQVANG